MGRGGKEDDNASVMAEGKTELDCEDVCSKEVAESASEPLMDKKEAQGSEVDLFLVHNSSKADAKDTNLMYSWIAVLTLLMTAHVVICAVIMMVFEDWEFETALYFALVTITTVGYGQFVPTRMGTKAYTIFFIVSGLIIAGVFVSVLQMKVLDSMIMRAHRHASRWTALLLPASLTLLFLAVYSTILIFMDDYAVIDAWYFVVVTFSTVGYGDVVLKSEGSRVLGIFFLLSGTLLFAFLLTTIINLGTTEYKIRQCQLFFSRPVTKARLREMDSNNSGDVSRAEFMEYMLLASNMVDPEIISEINSAFDKAAVSDGAAPQVAPRVVLNLISVKG